MECFKLTSSIISSFGRGFLSRNIAGIMGSVACLLLSTSLETQANEVRTTVPLDFGWKFVKGDVSGAHRPDLDDSDWHDVDVPHDWSIFGPFEKNNAVPPEDFTKWVRWTKDGAQGYLPKGIGWYRKHFTVPAEYESKKVFIEFDGVYRNSDVWLNGHHLGNHLSGYISFVYDLTPHLDYGEENVLSVRVDARKKEEWWYQGCGIYRHVRLLIVNKLHVAKWGTFVTTPEIIPGKATVKIRTQVQNDDNQPRQCTLVSKVMDMDHRMVSSTVSAHTIRADELYEFDQTVTVENPTLWSIENAYLYNVITEVKNKRQLADKYNTAFGIRTIFFDPQKAFFLNGKYVKIKGSDDHDDFAGLGTALPERIHIKRVELLKSAGANFLRASSHPFSKEILDAADRLGILMSQETRYFDDSPWGLKMLKLMIRKDRNHPCVILWCLGNEEAAEGTDAGSKTLKVLHEATHREDPTRFTYITQAHNYNESTFSDITDVLGCNWRSFPDLDNDHRKYPDRIMFLSEYNFSTKAWQQIMEREWLVGGGMWSGFTYKGELNWPNNSWPGHIYDMGGHPFRNYWAVKKTFTGIEEAPRKTVKGPAAALVLTPDRTELACNGQDVSVVQVALEGKNGYLVVDAYHDEDYHGAELKRSRTDVKVFFETTGAGKLAGVYNHDPYTHEVDKANVRSTYMGRCCAIVQAGRKPGKILLNARTETGLKSSLELETKKGVSPYELPPLAKKEPYLAAPFEYHGYKVGQFELSPQQIQSNQATTATIMLRNQSSLYPSRARLFVDDTLVHDKQYCVSRGKTRAIEIVTPRYYEPGRYQLRLDLLVNNVTIASKSGVFCVEVTPTDLEYADVCAPNYGYVGQDVAIKCKVKNIGGTKTDKVRVPLLINDKPVEAKRFTLAPGQSHSVKFTLKIPDAPVCRVKVGDSGVKEIGVLRPFPTGPGSKFSIHGSPMAVKGVYGSALKFDGNDDCIELKPIDLQNRSFTISAWVKVEHFGKNGEAPLFSGGEQKLHNGLHAGLRYGKPFMGFYGDDYYGQKTVPGNKWFFIAYVLDSTYIPPQTGLDGATASYENAQKVYVNGQLDGSRLCRFYKGTLTNIGSFWDASYFNGAIDEVRIYEKALNAEQVRSLYLEPESVQEKMLLWLSFDRHAGNE